MLGKNAARGADAGVGSHELVLGLEDVRAPLQQVRRQTRRHFGQQGLVQAQALRQVRRDPGAQQQDQRILVLGYQAGVLRQGRAGAFHGGLRLAQVERGGDADVVAALGQVETLLVGAQGVLGQLQLRLVGLQRQVGGRHAGHQGGLRAALRLFGRQVLLQGLVAQAAQAAEEIEFPGGSAQGHPVLAGNRRTAGGRQVARQTLAGAATVHADPREQVGPLDAVLRPEGLDVQRGDPQVAVVFQRHADQLLQLRVAEELAPADVGGRNGRRAGVLPVGLPLRVGRGYRRLGALVVGNQRAAGQNDSGYRQGKEGPFHIIAPFRRTPAAWTPRP